MQTYNEITDKAVAAFLTPAWGLKKRMEREERAQLTFRSHSQACTLHTRLQLINAIYIIRHAFTA
ncbi:hypothetical protein [Prevotella fusca]